MTSNNDGKTEEEFNISLAQLVEKYPCLYDFTRKDYNNTAIRTAAWQDISQSLNEGVEDCKLRWKSLRGCITRDKKFARQGNKSKKPYYLQEHLEFVKPFTRQATRTSRASVRLMAYPQNVDDPLCSEQVEQVEQVDANSQTVNIAIKQDGQDEFGEECIDIQQLHEMRTVQQVTARSEDVSSNKKMPEAPRDEFITLIPSEDNHPDMIFFRSLLPDINRMNLRQRSSFRLGVVSLIDQVLYGSAEAQFAEPQPPPSNACSTVVNWSH